MKNNIIIYYPPGEPKLEKLSQEILILLDNLQLKNDYFLCLRIESYEKCPVLKKTS